MWLWVVGLIFSLVTFANDRCYGTCEMEILSKITGKKIYKEQEEVNGKNKGKFLVFEEDENLTDGRTVCNVYFDDNIKHICSPLYRKLYIQTCRLPPNARMDSGAFFGCVIWNVWGPLNKNYARMVSSMRCEHIQRFHGYGKINNILREGFRWIHLDDGTLTIEENTGFCSLEIEFDGTEGIERLIIKENKSNITFCGDLRIVREVHLPVTKKENGREHNVFVSFGRYYDANCVNVLFPRNVLSENKQMRLINVGKSLSQTGVKELIVAGFACWRCFDTTTMNELVRMFLIGDVCSFWVDESRTNEIRKFWEGAAFELRRYIRNAVLMTDDEREFSIDDLIDVALNQNFQEDR